MKIFALSLFFLILNGCATLLPINYGKNLEGIWIYNHEANELAYSIVEYQSNGDKCELSIQANETNGVRIILYWNKWTVKEGVIHTTMYATNGGLEIGMEINDRIISIDKENFVAVVDNFPYESWDEELHIKNSRARQGQVCDIVRAALLPMVRARN